MEDECPTPLATDSATPFTGAGPEQGGSGEDAAHAAALYNAAARKANAPAATGAFNAAQLAARGFATTPQSAAGGAVAFGSTTDDAHSVASTSAVRRGSGGGGAAAARRAAHLLRGMRARMQRMGSNTSWLQPPPAPPASAARSDASASHGNVGASVRSGGGGGGAAGGWWFGPAREGAAAGHDADAMAALTRRLRPLRKSVPGVPPAITATATTTAADVTAGGASALAAAPEVGALPADAGIRFPATPAELFALPAADLDALAAFYNEPLWDRNLILPPRQKRAALARYIGLL